ncbi:antibiotic biosynthesis monooxygenase family protein [Priestia koreensis]|uniref:antibiotic biosynthesis monooxygenase family protein n=1 Tax=Priestia koreensis TaxID=284581 RepID=UPI003D029BE8
MRKGTSGGNLLKRIVVEEGYGDQVVGNFQSKTIIQEQPGFLDMSVMKKKQRRGDEEVLVMIRWESEEAWKALEKSDAHIAGHRANRGKEAPSYMINRSQDVYTVADYRTKQ